MDEIDRIDQRRAILKGIQETLLRLRDDDPPPFQHRAQRQRWQLARRRACDEGVIPFEPGEWLDLRRPLTRTEQQQVAEALEWFVDNNTLKLIRGRRRIVAVQLLHATTRAEAKR